MSTMLGERLREARLSQDRSLADVAGKANISVATLSRIENDKQSVDLTLFLSLAEILEVPPQQLIGSEDGNGNRRSARAADRRARSAGTSGALA